MLGKIEGRKRRGWQRMGCMDSTTDSMDVSLSKLQETVKNREAWCAVVQEVTKSWTWLSNWTRIKNGDRDLENRFLHSVREGEGGMNWESGIETYTLPYVKLIASGNLLYYAGSSKLVLCDSLEGLDRVGGGREVQEGGRFKREGTYVYSWLIHVDIWQKPTQYYKAIILQLKIKLNVKIQITQSKTGHKICL